VLTRHWDENETWLTVKRADPHVAFSDELLNEFRVGGDNGGMYPDTRLVAPEDRPAETPWVRHHDHDHYIDDKCGIPERCFTNWLLHIDARDRHLVYRIGEYMHKQNSWRATWPD
jgi:hypothetical protein